MEYERIHKVQTAIISPSKLRMKLIGPHSQKKKEGSNSNSSRTSPSKLVEDAEFVKNLLAPKNCDFDDEASTEASTMKVPANSGGQPEQVSCHPKDSVRRENGHMARLKTLQLSRGDNSSMSTIHPVRNIEEENLDYDSNASSSSFEFHKGERSSLHNHTARSFSRTVPSKWNDAEKWIINRQNGQSNYSKKSVLLSQTNRLPVTKRVDFCQPPLSEDLKEAGAKDLSCTSLYEDTTTGGMPAIRSVSMRDMGTEMTPMTSQEPSRTGTPVGATTPLRSPTSSIPSTPRGGAPPTPVEDTNSLQPLANNITYNSKTEYSEEELKLKTRREIVALGVQLGKMNIAAWASKDDKEKNNTSSVENINMEEIDRIEFEKRAAAWEEAEKSRHAARYKREEIKIQAWESQEKAKLEAETRKIEAQVEQMRAHAQAKMVKKIAMARQRAEESRAAAEARKNREAERTAAQADYIRQTGQMPSSPFICCGWLR